MNPDIVAIVDEVGSENFACLWTWNGKTMAVLENGVVLLPRAFVVTEVLEKIPDPKLPRLRLFG